jgi:hypothetical protein
VSTEQTLIEMSSKIGALEASVEALQAQNVAMAAKIDALLAAANMGRGAWWLLMKIGGALLVIGTAIAWAVERFEKFWKVSP